MGFRLPPKSITLDDLELDGDVIQDMVVYNIET